MRPERDYANTKCIAPYCRKMQKVRNYYCSMHASRLTRTGKLERIIKPVKERLLENIVVDKKTKCWNWIGYQDKLGYGKLRIKNKRTLAHRASYVLFKGEIPSKMLVCHACDNPNCINPDHLWLGTHGDNSRDAANKNRYPDRKGEGCANHKLTTKDVLKIRKLIEKGKTDKELSEIYNVTKSTIYAIKNRKSWKHI